MVFALGQRMAIFRASLMHERHDFEHHDVLKIEFLPSNHQQQPYPKSNRMSFSITSIIRLILDDRIS